MSIPNPSEPFTVGEKVSPVWYLALRKIVGNASNLSDSKAGAAQMFEQSFLIEYPENKDYRVVINAAVGRTITSVTTRSSTGTCTLTPKINTTALGGGANSVSTTEQTKTHASANAMAAGDDLVLTVSSVSSCENVSITVSGTLTLAA